VQFLVQAAYLNGGREEDLENPNERVIDQEIIPAGFERIANIFTKCV
jgi:hypothetical protein